MDGVFKGCRFLRTLVPIWTLGLEESTGRDKPRRLQVVEDKGTGMRIPLGDKKAFGSRACLHSSDSVEGLVSTVLLQEIE